MPRTAVERIEPAAPDPAVLKRAADVLRAGGLVAFPTETVYGLGANALDPAAVVKVFAAKGRPATNPLIVHVADTAGASAVAEWSSDAARLAEAFWPGPLTLVLPKTAAVPEVVTGEGATVAVRCPAHPVARGLIAAAGVPVAAPSANRSGELSPTRADHVLKGLDGRIDLLLDGGPCPAGVESTVVDVVGRRVLRPGPIPVPKLAEVIGPLAEGGVAAGGALPSPGMLARHYAPRTALEVAETEQEAEFLADLYRTAGLKVARWSAGGEPAAVAARLYADLHELDAGGFDRIIAALPPTGPEWRAVRDRLSRAAAEDL
jgi:L-threonylcarbamoyladenylate synthase